MDDQRRVGVPFRRSPIDAGPPARINGTVHPAPAERRDRAAVPQVQLGDSERCAAGVSGRAADDGGGGGGGHDVGQPGKFLMDALVLRACVPCVPYG